MTDAEILKAAIERAQHNGYILMSDFVRATMDWAWYMEHRKHFGLIFSHEFAKAYWGEENLAYEEYIKLAIVNPKDEPSFLILPSWTYHLQQMVLEENPIKYLEQFL